ncbi:hypothetical protein TNCV_4691781 [Trichonephila clavipes]|nr:hypothetical protein TNCV_4691781 [Trichonephila clavipes]
MQPDLKMHICEHIIRVLQHQKDVNQKQHICVKRDFVRQHPMSSSRAASRNKKSMGFKYGEEVCYIKLNHDFRSTFRKYSKCFHTGSELGPSWWNHMSEVMKKRSSVQAISNSDEHKPKSLV